MASIPNTAPIRMHDAWLPIENAAGRIGYADALGLLGFLAHYGYADGRVPSAHALSSGVVRPEDGGWVWSEAFLVLLAKAAGVTDALCGHDTPDSIGRGLARALGDILLRRAAWKDAPAWRSFAASPDAEVVRGLRFGGLLNELARDRGPAGALAAIGPVLARILSACDAGDPVVAQAAASIADGLSRLARIDGDHPLVRYGIVRGADPMALAA